MTSIFINYKIRLLNVTILNPCPAPHSRWATSVSSGFRELSSHML